MKRGWTILLAGALILAIALPVGAVKPGCEKLPIDDKHYCGPVTLPPSTTTTIPAVVECEFEESDDGILHLKNWWSEDQSEPYRCRWTTSESDRGPNWSFTFHLTAGSEDDDARVLRPHMFVTDSHPYGDKCFDDMDNGWHLLPYAWERFSLPATGECDDSFPEVDPDGEDVFSLLISARVKGTAPETGPEVTVEKKFTPEVTVPQS